MDRLGGGGLGAANATKLHFNPSIKMAANDAGVGLRLLPVKGGYSNPVELFWDHFKKMISDTAPPGPERYDSFGCRVRGPTTWSEFKVMAAEVVQKMNATEGLFRSFIHRRGLGGEFDKRWSETAAYKAALPRVQPYDVMALAFRPQLVEHSAEPPKSRALCASYCGWWLAHVALGASMVPSTPPPGPAGPCGGDGYENTCRACGTGETKAHPAGTLLLCDVDGCTAAWHTKCLGLKSVPPGRWECPCCVHAPGKACMPQWPAVAPRKGSKAAKLAQAPQLNLLVEEGDDGEESDAN